MHGAPTVSYPVGRSLLGQAFFVLPWVLGGFGLLFWSLQAQSMPMAQVVSWLLWFVVGVALLRELKQASEGEIEWDGLHWRWSCQGRVRAGHVSVRLDGQDNLLLEFRGLERGRAWFWLDRACAPLHWATLRRALVAGDCRPNGDPLAQGKPA